MSAGGAVVDYRLFVKTWFHHGMKQSMKACGLELVGSAVEEHGFSRALALRDVGLQPLHLQKKKTARRLPCGALPQGLKAPNRSLA